MYEKFRADVLSQLADIIDDVQTVQNIMGIIDNVASHYDFTEQTTALIVRPNMIPNELKLYLVSRSIEGLSPRTIRLYQHVMTRFFNAVAKPLNEITTNDIRIYIYNYRKTGTSDRTIETYRVIISAFFRWCLLQGYICNDPAALIKRIKYEKKPRHAMDQLDLQKIRANCITPKEKAIVQFLYSTGCRVSQLVSLKISDVDIDKKQVHLFGKGRKHRISYLNAKAIYTLTEYLKTRTDKSEALFIRERAPYNALTISGVEYIIREICNRAGLDKNISPHIFRHTTATVAMQNGMPVQGVQQMLGHSNINTTMIYAQTSDTETKQMHKKYVV